MKVTPGSQTLILASERGPAAGMPAVGLSQIVGPTGNDPVLQRLTIVAARPDSTMVYLRADYAADSHSPSADAAGTYDVTGNALVAAGQTQRSLMRATASGAALPATRPDPYGSSRGISLYESTQRMSLETVTAVHVDVHA